MEAITLDFLLNGSETQISFLFIVGGNSIGQQHKILRGIQMMMKAVLADIKERLPKSMIIYFHILQRTHWSNVVANLEGKKCRL